ncbi:hypothetical protein ID866_9988, partial [Astraeus odoratus]
MGKQGLRALQSLNNSLTFVADASVTFPRTRSPPPPRSLGSQKLDPSSSSAPQGPISYSSDISSLEHSLTPSQSASQRASSSTEVGQEVHIYDKIESSRTATQAEEEIFYQGHVTITLPPAHAISELDLPTAVRTSPPGTPTPAATPPAAPSTPAPNGHTTSLRQDTSVSRIGSRRARSKQRRPISRHISEASDEGAPEEQAADATPSVAPRLSSVPKALSDTGVTNGLVSRRSGSSDGLPQGPLEVVENNPFASVRSKNVFLRPPTEEDGGLDEIPSPDSGKGKAPRERKTSMTFLGSLRGLFRPRGRTRGMDSPSAVWEGPVAAEPSVGKGGWVTRIDGHLRAGRESSDSEAGAGPSNRRALSGTGTKSKLRKMRGLAASDTPSQIKRAGSNGGSSTRAGTGGWLTDGGHGQGSGRRRSKRRKKSIAALRGPELGFTDGEVDHAPVMPLGDDDSQARSAVLSRSSSLARTSVKSSPSNLEQSTGANAKRNRRATTDFSNVGTHTSNGNTLEVSVSAPRVRRSSTTPPTATVLPSQPSMKSPSPQSTTHVEAHPASGVSKMQSTRRRSAKPGILHTPNGSADQSLMSIVEDVTRQNRERRLASAHAASSGHTIASGSELPMLDVPRAPSSQIPPALTPGHSSQANWLGHLSNASARSLDLPRRGSAVAPSQPIRSSLNGRKGSPTDKTNGNTAASNNGDSPRPLSRPAKSPLRSALRNASRTPSPNPTNFAGTGSSARENGAMQQNQNTPEPDMPRGRSVERLFSAGFTATSDPRDSISISSYKTGRESPMSSTPSPSPSPQPSSLPPQGSGDHNGTSSTVSTEITPARRKSVRVSLQPTFSPTPPALYDQFDEDDMSGEGVVALSSQPAVAWKTRR